MSDSVLGRVALSFQIVWGPEREASAIVIDVQAQSEAALDGAHLVAAIGEFWQQRSVQLLLRTASPRLLGALLERTASTSAWIAVDHDAMQNEGVAAAVKAAAGRGVPLVWRGALGTVVPPQQTRYYALQMVTLNPTQTLVALACAGQPPSRGVPGAVRPPVLSGVLCEGLASQRMASHALDDAGAAGVVGWPLEEAALKLRHAPMPPDGRLIRELMQEIDQDVSMEALETRLGCDPALAYRFLRYANSALLGLRSEVGSLRHGLMMVGASTLRQWLAEQLPHASDDPDLRPLRALSVFRARLVEQLVDAGTEGELRRELYLCGLFADLDLLMGTPHRLLLQHVPLPPRVADAITHNVGPYAPYLALARAMGQTGPLSVAEVCEDQGMSLDDANRALLHMLGSTEREFTAEADLLGA